MERLKGLRQINLLLFIGALTIVSCTKYETPPPIAGDIPGEGEPVIQRRVLWINIDGAVGQVVKDHMPPTLKGMLSHSKYTFEALSDNRMLEDTGAEDPVNWTTMLTGMIAEKHKVRDDSYIPDLDVDPNEPDQEVAYYPNVIGRITEAFPNAKTLCITPWQTLNGNMLNNAYRTITSASDEETRDLVVESLQTEDMDFTLVSFKSMLEAGKTGGFSGSNTEYLSTLTTIDGYIRECLDAINAREDAAHEDWLVIVTSNHGGKEDGTWNGTSNIERNSFCMFYYNHYSSQLMKGETLYGAYFDRDYRATLDDPDQLYSAGEGRTLSVEMIVRFEPGPAGGYGGSGWQSMMRKRSWSIHRQRSEVIFRMEAGENGINAIQENFNTITNSLWHSYQLGIASPTRTTKNFMMLYDGNIMLSAISQTASYIEDRDDLQIGGTSIPTNYYIAELRIWDKMLDETTYIENSSQLNIEPSHPEYDHLIGYWKFKPESLTDETTIKNEIEGMPSLEFNQPPRMAEFANTLPLQRRTGNLVMENTLIAPQILYWLNAGSSSEMDGFSFLENYNLEEAWREE